MFSPPHISTYNSLASPNPKLSLSIPFGIERGEREREKGMDDILNPFRAYQTTGEKVQLINGNGCAVTKLYVVCSRPPNPFCPASDVCTSFASLSGSSQSKGLFNGRETTKSKGLFNGRKMKRRKKNMKYKWYAVEGKVKASLKNGYR